MNTSTRGPSILQKLEQQAVDMFKASRQVAADEGDEAGSVTYEQGVGLSLAVATVRNPYKSDDEEYQDQVIAELVDRAFPPKPKRRLKKSIKKA